MAFSLVKKNKFTKGKHTKDGNKYKNPRGFWEWTTYRKPTDGCVSQIKHTSTVDPHKMDMMINPQLSLIEKIKERKEKGEKINKADTIRLENYIEKTNNSIAKDLENIEKYGLNSDVKTDIGRIEKLFMIAEKKINDEDMIYYIYQKINEFTLSEDMLSKHSELLSKMKSIISNLDTIELQFNKFSSNMPPLNTTGFVTLDEWQKDVIRNINSNTTTIIQAPTSAGKSILTGYLYTKNIKAIVVVPTSPLCLQMAAMITKTTGHDTPILTRTFQSLITRDDMIEKINNTGILVGTPQEIIDYLPMLDIEPDWIVVDEIHMIGKQSCCEMETICKLYYDKPILALSATIGNVEDLKDWFLKTGQTKVDIIKCNKRFFNLQKFYYNEENTSLNRIHPLSMVTFTEFKDESIKKRNLNATPPDIYDLADKLDEKFDLGELCINKYFTLEQRITLDEANEYFTKLIDFMVKEGKTKKSKIIKSILNQYKPQNVNNGEIDIVKFAFTLKEANKTPAIIFDIDSYSCLDKVKTFSKTIKKMESEKYPNRFKELQKLVKKQKMIEKKKEQLKIEDKGEKQMRKMMMDEKYDGLFSEDINVSLNEPHKDFILNKNQYFSQYQIEDYVHKLKKYFPNEGSEYNYMIDLLYRGIGVYVKGLPQTYLRLVQTLACEGQLAIVFSDISLVFGVSMPFRTSVITNDPNIDTMLYHQMAGRAGRRGLDKEGNVIFIEQTWNRIKELSVSFIPNIKGFDTMNYGTIFSSKLSKDDRWNKLYGNFLMEENNQESEEFYEIINYNIQENNAWDFVNSNDNNFNFMLWKFRHTENCFRLPIFIQYIKKLYKNCSPDCEANQIEIAHLLLMFIDPVEVNDDYKHKLPEFTKITDINIYELLDSIELEISNNIDGRLYYSIQANCLFKTDNKIEKNILREKLMDFIEYVRIIQHYFYQSKEIIITRLLGKLLTRLFWIYLNSSPFIM